MVIWISGAYGVGKSTLAEALEKQLNNAVIFDAEEVGNAVRESYPGWPYGAIFEDYPLWSRFCYELIRDLHNTFGRNIIVPMTMLRRSSYINIIEKLLAGGIDVRFIILEASHASIHDRILARGEEEDCWCIQNIDTARQAVSAFAEGYHIDTDSRSVEQLTRLVLEHITGGR